MKLKLTLLVLILLSIYFAPDFLGDMGWHKVKEESGNTDRFALGATYLFVLGLWWVLRDALNDIDKQREESMKRGERYHSGME